MVADPLLSSDSAFTLETLEGVQVLHCRPLRDAVPEVVHAFTTRDLELRVRGPISAARVAGDKQRLADALGMSGAAIVELRQVHGHAVVVLERADRIPPTHPVADAALSGVADVALAVGTADCVAILIAERGGQAIAAVHAGWRGLVAGVARLAAETLIQLGAAPPRLIAAIGPSAGPCCYEVGPEVVDARRPPACRMAA